jgi:hypothetical protein
MTFLEAMEHVAELFEAIGALVLLGGLVVSIAVAVQSWRRDHDGTAAYQRLRATFGGVILLGLEPPSGGTPERRRARRLEPDQPAYEIDETQLPGSSVLVYRVDAPCSSPTRAGSPNASARWPSPAVLTFGTSSSTPRRCPTWMPRPQRRQPN